ncbi:MAG: 50S ribosomal protein L32 [Gammaproteobacteria bacterium]|nr:50S ribosomal protein L32 [Gammaproteobacteria bacterium]
MGVPKRKTSKSRRDKRRTHQRLNLPGLSVCPQCQEVQLPHHVCPTCGFYKGKQVIEVSEV